MKEFDQYRLWIIVGVGLMSIFVILVVWRYYYYTRRKQTGEPTDYGLVFLMAGIGIWAILSIMKLSAFPAPLPSCQIHTMSMINNAFLLSSITFFEYSRLLNSSQFIKRNWPVISGVSALVVLVIIFFLPEDHIAADLLDWGFSTIIFLILGGILFRTFDERRLSPIGYLAFLVMIMTIGSQIIIMLADNKNPSPIDLDLKNIGFIIGGISFSMMLVILVALAFTWILDENNVFEAWDDDRKAKEFWASFTGKWDAGVRVLRKEMDEGLSRLYFKKCTTLFDIEDLPNRQTQVMQDLEAEIIATSGRFGSITTAFQKSEISELAYLTEIAKIRGFVMPWFDRLRNALGMNSQAHLA